MLLVTFSLLAIGIEGSGIGILVWNCARWCLGKLGIELVLSSVALGVAWHVKRSRMGTMPHDRG